MHDFFHLVHGLKPHIRYSDISKTVLKLVPP
ncbi:hypothetical protein COMA2_160070 [Candidatus Nitrospira nitrificans]|uniref:Uncharacterized protein n=1 Tax=Candidatus Nitrospira nitrificans TaxID=1742973 RepID=A0A0S4LCJ6_9BACT|nr:hypothetical protein COMA2_160070 [Candidatus Nitrospira nitrificans]